MRAIESILIGLTLLRTLRALSQSVNKDSGNAFLPRLSGPRRCWGHGFPPTGRRSPIASLLRKKAWAPTISMIDPRPGRGSRRREPRFVHRELMIK